MGDAFGDAGRRSGGGRSFLELALEYSAADYGVTLGRRICMFGVDDMSIAGDVVSDLADEISEVPVFMVSDGRVPGWVTSEVHCILMSYDGDCPEILETYRVVSGRGCPVVCICSGGALADAGGRDGCNVIRIDGSVGARAASGSALGIIASILQSSGVMDAKDALDSAVASAGRIAESANPGRLADSLRGRVVAVYSTSDIHSSAKRWMQAIDSEVCDLVFYGELPEYDHNELVGWSDPNVHAPELQMTVIRGSTGPGLVDSIVGCMMDVLSENGRDVVEVPVGNGDSLGRNLRAMALADATARHMREKDDRGDRFRAATRFRGRPGEVPHLQGGTQVRM